MAKLKLKMVASKLREMSGNISATARAFGCSRSNVQYFIGKHPELQEVLQDAREAMLDDAESVLQKKVLEGEAWAVCFLLKTQGKARGYVERTEQIGAHLHVGWDELLAELNGRGQDGGQAGSGPDLIERRIVKALPLPNGHGSSNGNGNGNGHNGQSESPSGG